MFNNIDTAEKLIVTTEKDAMRLSHPNISSEVGDLPIYYQKIEVEIDNREEFDTIIYNYVAQA